jgi:uncharacterized protein YaiE (UPF0345 family)
VGDTEEAEEMKDTVVKGAVEVKDAGVAGFVVITEEAEYNVAVKILRID